MTISLVNIGSFVNGTTSLSVAYPASISAGNMLLLFIVNKYPTAGPSTPSGGWALLAQKEGGSGSPGADSGNVYTTVYWKEADGTESGNVSVTITSGNAARGAILNFSKTTGSWDLSASGGAVNTPTTSWSAVTDAGIALAAGDMLVALTGGYSDASSNFTSHALAASGITFGTVSEAADGGTGSGDDLKAVAAYGEVSSGSGSGAVTYSASTGANSQAGSTVVVRLRESTGTSGAVSPPAASSVFAALAPTVAGAMSGNVAPPAASSVFAALAPTVAGAMSGSVSPPAASSDFTALAPTVSIGQVGSVSPPAAASVFVALAPSVAGARSGAVAPPAAGSVFAALAPTVAVTSSGSVSPPAAASVFAALAPTVAAAEALTPARSYSNPIVHLLEATPFDESVSDTISAVPAPFGSWAFAGDPAFSIVTGGSDAIYAADGWFNSLPADTPANQHYPPVLLSPFNFQVSLFEGLEPTGRAAVGFGDIVIDNGDGWLDAVIDFGWSGRPISLYRGTPFTARATFVKVFEGALDGLTPDERTVSLRLRTREALLNRPLQSTLYLGTGGKEGGTDLFGKRKPLGYGRLFNVPGVMIDAPNLVLQLHDGEIEQVDAVRDKGVALAFDADYASYALLLAASIASGEYGTCLAEGLIRLGAANEGQITVDFRGEAATAYVETAGSIARRLVTTRLDTVNLTDPTDLDTDSFDQLATDQPAPIGFWDGPDSGLTVGQALDQIMASVGGWWTFTLPGLLSVAILKAPSGTPDAVLERADILLGPPFALQGGVPSYRRLVGYQRAWTVQAQDSLAAGVTPANKLLYSTQYRLASTTDAAVLTKHRNAREVLTAGLFALEADADSEAARLQTLHGSERRIVAVGVRPDNPFDAPLGGVVEIRDFNRLTLSSSQKFRLVGLSTDLSTGETTWILWG